MTNRIRIFVILVGFMAQNAVSSEAASVTEEVMRSILKETGEAALRNDYYGTIRYYYPGSKMVYDLDPDPESQKYELGYDEFIPQIQLDLGYFKDSEVSEEILESWVSDDSQQGETITRTLIVHSLFGTRTETLVDTLVRFAVIDGEVKIVYEEMELLRREQTQ